MNNNFGKLNGTPISNKDTILSEINEKLATDKNPDVEYLLSRPYSVIPLLFGYGINYNFFGHSSVRYNLNGLDIVANIEGKRNGQVMVVFYDAKEYLYGTNELTNGAQRGVYNRNIAGIRIENVSHNKILTMHNYFLDLQEQEKNGYKKFNLFAGPLINFIIRGIIRWCKNHSLKCNLEYSIFDDFNYEATQNIEYGNCAKWISEGLKRANICTDTKTWPKSILIDIFENYTESDTNIVLYQQPEHSILEYGFRRFTLFESVAPLQPIRDYIYSNLLSYARCVVTIPTDGIIAIPQINPTTKTPDKIRNIVNNNWAVFVSTIIFAPISYVLLKKSAKFALMVAGFKRKINKHIKDF